MMHNVSRVALVGAVGLTMAWSSLAHATTVRRASVAELARSSSIVFHGVVRKVNDHLATSKDGPFRTALEIEVLEILKGRHADPIFSLTLPGGRAFDRVMRIPGMPIFAPGDEVVLMLERHTSGFALTGLAQGVFRIDRSSGSAIAARDLSGLHVLDLSPAKAKGEVVLAERPTLDALLSFLKVAVDQAGKEGAQ